MLKGIKGGVLIEVKDVTNDIVVIKEKLMNDDFFGRNLDFYLTEKDRSCYDSFYQVLNARGHNLYLIKNPEEQKEELRKKENQLKEEMDLRYEEEIKKIKEEIEKKDEKSETETLIVKKTLRSGQRVESKGNVLIIGDVNPGAEVFADGDVFIFGRARGIVHAGRSGNKDKSILAMSMEVNQIRIANVYAKGDGKKPEGRMSELAYIDNNNNLIIEEYKIY